MNSSPVERIAVIGFCLAMTLIGLNEIVARITDPPPQTATAVVTDPPTVTVIIEPVATTTTTAAPQTTTTTAHDALQADLDELALGDLLCQEWAPLALDVGWPVEELPTLLAIIWRESRCQPDADSGPDQGLLQLNDTWRDEFETYFGPWSQVFDPRLNLAMGYEIWRWFDAHHGCGWEPWSRSC